MNHIEILDECTNEFFDSIPNDDNFVMFLSMIECCANNENYKSLVSSIKYGCNSFYNVVNSFHSSIDENDKHVIATALYCIMMHIIMNESSDTINNNFDMLDLD